MLFLIQQAHISGTKLERPELSRLLIDSQQGDTLFVEQIDRLTRLNNTDWLKLKKQIEQHELRIVSLDIPISWQALNNQAPTQSDPITHAVLSAINTILIDLMAVMPHKDWSSRREQQKFGKPNDTYESCTALTLLDKKRTC